MNLSMDDLVVEHIIPCIKPSKQYQQKVAWLGTILEDNQIEDMENWFLNELGFHVKYADKFEINENPIVIFYVRDDDLERFAMFRLKTDDMKWWEDFYDWEHVNMPSEIKMKYPKCW